MRLCLRPEASMSFEAKNTGCRPPRSSEDLLSLHLRMPARKASKEV